MKNIEKIIITGLVFVLFIGTLVYFVFRKKKPHMPETKNMTPNDSSPSPTMLNRDLDIVNSANVPLRNEIGSNICQEIQTKSPDSNSKPNVFFFPIDTLSSYESDDIKDFNNFIVGYNDFCFKDTGILSKYTEYRSSKEFKRNIPRTPEKLNLKEISNRLFSGNLRQLIFIDKLLYVIRSGLDSGEMCQSMINFFEECSGRNDNVIVDICNKIKEKVIKELETQEIVDLIKEKMEFFSDMRIHQNLEYLNHHMVQIPYNKTIDDNIFESYMNNLFNVADECMKILGFRELIYILLMKPFKKIKYCTDSSDIMGIKQNFIFYFNRSVCLCYLALLGYINFFAPIPSENIDILRNEVTLADHPGQLNHEIILLGKDEHIHTLLNFCFTRYFCIICFMMFSCNIDSNDGDCGNYTKILSWFDLQDGSLNSKNLSKPDFNEVKSYYDQTFFVIFKVVRLFYHIVNPENTINDEYFSTLETYILDIAQFLDNYPISRKILSTFFEFE